MRSSGLRGHSSMFSDALSCRSRLTRRWILPKACSRLLVARSAKARHAPAHTFTLLHGIRLRSPDWKSSTRRSRLRADRISIPPSKAFKATCVRGILSVDLQAPTSAVKSRSKSTGFVSWPNPTMRSSGPRRQSMVFSDTRSGRGRLTRRWAAQ
jgi:hypothetical protein